jgi:transcriptional regulator with XRE-family HTH domain
MANRERPRDRGVRIGRQELIKLGREARDARVQAGLTQRAVADSVGVHRSWVGSFEQGKAPGIGFQVVATILSVVGLDLSARAYPGGDAIRDAGQAAMIGRFLAVVPDSVGRAVEVPFPNTGDPRAWDVRLRIGSTTWGVEAETHVGDLQATLRRMSLKRRDGLVDGMLLLLLDSRHHRRLLREHRSLLAGSYPGDAREAMALLRAGRPPMCDTIILI